MIPDVLPSVVGPHVKGEFSFAAGDFLEVYGNDRGAHSTSHQAARALTDSPPSRPAESWDSIVTCFFIDTARNIVEYLQQIHRLLKPGGTWINLGPSLWHFENTAGASSIELTMDEIKALAQRIGFKIEVSPRRAADERR